MLDGFDEATATSPHHDRRAASPRCAPRPTRPRSPSSRCATATAASSASTSPAAKPAIRPTRHLDAFRTIAEANHHITIHAGEAFGLPSIWEAIQICGAERLGHGVRIVDDIEVDDDGGVRLGQLASFVRDRRVPLEMCPTSNVHTGVVDDLADHPIGLLTRLRFRVTVNTDNRLMSDITLSQELANLCETFGYGWSELEWFTVNAMKSSFWPFDKRLRLINEIIKPGYAAMRARSLESMRPGRADARRGSASGRGWPRSPMLRCASRRPRSSPAPSSRRGCHPTP